MMGPLLSKSGYYPSDLYLAELWILTPILTPTGAYTRIHGRTDALCSWGNLATGQTLSDTGRPSLHDLGSCAERRGSSSLPFHTVSGNGKTLRQPRRWTPFRSC